MRAPCPPLVPLFFLLVAPVPGQEATADPAVPELRRYDLQALLAPMPGIAGRFEAPGRLVLPWGLPIDTGGGPGEIALDGGAQDLVPARFPLLTARSVRDWIERVTGTEDEVSTMLVEDELLLHARSGSHARVADLLALLTAIRLGIVTVELHTLEGVPRTGSAVLDPDAVRELLEREAPIASTIVHLHPDVPVLHESGRAIRYLKDYGVDVASDARIADPKLDVIFEGERLGLAVTPACDGRWLVRLGFQVNEVEEVDRMRLDGTGLGTLELPDVTFDQVRTAAALPPGGGLLLATGRETRLLVLREVTEATLRGAGAGAVPLGSLGLPPMAAPSLPDPVRRPEEGGSGFDGAFGPAAGDPVPVLDHLLGGALSNREVAVATLGSHALFFGNEGLREQTIEILRKREASRTSHSVRWRIGSVPDESLAAAGDDSALARSLETGGIVAVLPRNAFAAASARQRAFVGDYEVEISEEAMMANPVPDHALTGWFLRGRLETGAQGRIGLWLDVLRAREHSGTPLDTGIDEIGTLDVPDTTFTRHDVRVDLTPGRWHRVWQQPDPSAPGRSLVLLVAVDGG